MNYNSEEEKFWAGEFGNSYAQRHNSANRIAFRTAIFSKILWHANSISSVLEFGANVGQNLLAIRNILPSSLLSAVEINPKAIETLNRIPDLTVHQGSIFDFSIENLKKHDLTFTSGVLIHINPNLLNDVYARLYECSNRYILVNEYYNPTPVEVDYQGHSERLYKRDFAGAIMDKYPDLELIDYGFLYHRDNNYPTDDSTWFLLKKSI